MTSIENHHYIDEGSLDYASVGHAQYVDLLLLKTELKSKRTQNVYIPIRKISHGHFSTVYLSFNKTEKNYVAIKICKCDPEYETAFKEECQIMKNINNFINSKALPDNGGIVKMLDYFIYEQKTYSDDMEEVTSTKRHYCFVMELLGHSVYKLMLRYAPTINTNKAIPIPVVKTIAKSLLQSLTNLHSSGYIHTDIKPENISLKYFLPEIDQSADYKIQELIFGKQSTYLFDSKLCTPAKYINESDLKRLQSEERGRVIEYLKDVGQQKGYQTWLDVRAKVIDNSKYCKDFQNFLIDNQVNPQEQNVYKINGLNVFNVVNLMQEAEKLFRLNYVLSKDSLQQLKIDTDVTRQLQLNNDPKVSGLLQKIKMQNETSIEQEPSPSHPQKRDFLSLLSAKYKLNKLMHFSHNQEQYYDYQVIEDEKLNTTQKVIKSQMGMEFSVNIQNFNQNMQLFAEKLYFDEQKPETIHALAANGLHSRFALMKIKLDNGLFVGKHRNHSNQILFPGYKKHELKCFAMTQQNKLAFPVMVSYYQKNSLIPFCKEMFQTKLLDLGNAYLVDDHKASIIQTRQYRSPEVIMGCNYNETADVFSAACVIFELLTGNYLFQTKQQTNERKRDSLHMNAILSVMGEEGLQTLRKEGLQKRIQEIEKFGQMANIKQTPISSILVNEYNFDEKDAIEIEDFLKPMLAVDHKKRCSAQQALQSHWLRDIGDGDYLISYGGRQW